jgi:sugar phosphate isomerase/epimerase
MASASVGLPAWRIAFTRDYRGHFHEKRTIMMPIQDPHRRKFLKQAALATLAGGAALHDGFAAAPASSRMTLGFSTYGMRGMKTEDAIMALAKIGYDAVELNVWPGRDLDAAKVPPKRAKAIGELARHWSIRPTALMENLKIERDAKKHAAALERLRRAAAFARQIAPDAPPLVETTLGGGEWDQVKGLYQERLADWAEVGREMKTVMAIKPHRFGAMDRPAHAIELIKGLGEPKWLRMAYDFSHYAHRDMTLAATIKEALPFTAFVAIKDTVMVGGKARFVLPGESGEIDYVKLLRLFHEGGYRGDINCEVSGMVSGKKGYDPIRAAETSYANIAPAFVEAKVARP